MMQSMELLDKDVFSILNRLNLELLSSNRSNPPPSVPIQILSRESFKKQVTALWLRLNGAPGRLWYLTIASLFLTAILRPPVYVPNHMFPALSWKIASIDSLFKLCGS